MNLRKWATAANNIEQRTVAGKVLTFNKFAWYPGDEYIDWFSFNVWSDDSARDTDPSFDATWYMEQASAHQKPVLIGETSYHATSYSWSDWIEPFLVPETESGSAWGIALMAGFRNSWEVGGSGAGEARP